MEMVVDWGAPDNRVAIVAEVLDIVFSCLWTDSVWVLREVRAL